MYDSLVAKGDEMKNKFEFEQGQSNLSEDAKTLAKKVKSIITNDDLTFQQTCKYGWKNWTEPPRQSWDRYSNFVYSVCLLCWVSPDLSRIFR